MPYEPNPSGVMSAGEAFSMGNQTGAAIGNGITNAVQLQQQLEEAQLRKQELQGKIEEHRANMVNTMGEGLYQLAAADDDEKKGPVWKAKKEYYLNGFQHLGMQVDPDAIEAMLKDPTHSQKLAAAISALNNSDLTPVQKAQALAAGGPYLGSIEGVTKVADQIATAQAKLLQAGNRSSQFIDTQAKNIRDKVQTVNKTFDTSSAFSDEASNILKNWGSFSTGQAVTALKDAYNKAMSGGAPRSFTLAMMDQNRAWGTKIDGYMQKIENGQNLTEPERVDMAKSLSIMKTDTDNKRYQQLSPYYNAAKSLMTKAQGNNMQLNPSEMIPQDHWNKLVDFNESKTLNTETGKYEGGPKEAAKNAPKANAPKQEGLPTYEVGSSQSKDNAIRILIKSGKKIDFINNALKASGVQLSPSDYSNLKKGQ